MLDSLFTEVAEERVAGLDVLLNDWFFLIAIPFLGVELIRYGVLGRLGWRIVADAAANYVSLAVFIGVVWLLIAASGGEEGFRGLLDIPINPLTIALCVVLADLAYYWEHRFTHRVNAGWATHSVHHSSPYFNISVAYRFGPLDGFWPYFFSTLPLMAAGFNPVVVIFADAFVQLYQTLLHTELIGKLPRVVEAVMNTPSHHRAHHGMNAEYLDKNYGGVFIVWDRLFGTFEPERAPVVYGLTAPIDSVNPAVVMGHGFYRLGKAVASARTMRGRIGYVVGPPEYAEPPAKA